jgi:formate dehydrogenase subunit gamma
MTAPTLLHRFTRIERAVHWTAATLMVVCILTALALYNGSIGLLIGHRHTVELIHVYCGLALPVPVLLGLVSVAYRADLRRLNRFTRHDWRWLRTRRRHESSIPVGKFNAGQKVNTSVATGATLVMLGTGLLMFFPGLVRLSWRTGATLVHDWVALALGLLIVGHIWFALRDRHAMAGMIGGRVPAHWARAEHGEWARESGAGEPADP